MLKYLKHQNIAKLKNRKILALRVTVTLIWSTHVATVSGDWIISSKLEFSERSDGRSEVQNDVRFFLRRSDRRRSMFLQIFREVLDDFSPNLECVWL